MKYDGIYTSNFEANTKAIFNNLKSENLFFIFEIDVKSIVNWIKHIKETQYDAVSKIDLALNEMAGQ